MPKILKDPYYNRDVVWDIEDFQLSKFVSELIESYLCDVHHASHPDDPVNNPWDCKTGSLNLREYDEFNKIWNNLNLKLENKALYKISDGKLNTKINISQFGIDLLLSMIDFYTDVPRKNEERMNDLIVLRDSLDNL